MASPKMFILVSLDFGGSTAVSLHAVTTDEKAARDAYHELEGRYKENNEKGNNQGYSMLIELFESTREFVCPAGLTLYWNQVADGPRSDRCGGPRNSDRRYAEAGLRVVLSNNEAM